MASNSSMFAIGTEENSDLMTTTLVNIIEVTDKIRKLVEEKKLKNSPETVVSILGGTHGAKDGTSAFSYMYRSSNISRPRNHR